MSCKAHKSWFCAQGPPKDFREPETEIHLACLGLQAAITVLNRCLSTLPAISHEHHDVLEHTAKAVGDLHGLLRSLLVEMEEIHEKDVGCGWLVVDTGEAKEPNESKTRGAFKMLPQFAIPKSAHEIVWSRGLSGTPQEDSLWKTFSESFNGERASLGQSVARESSSAGTFSLEDAEEYPGADWAAQSSSSSFCCSNEYEQLLELFATQGALAKTIKNDEWPTFLEKLNPPGIRTSTSLLPPYGRHMRLFGTEAARCCGLIWDRNLLNLKGCWAWPSGYYAKTEFNIDANGRLKNGREDALVLVEDLLVANANFTTQRSYNEVYTVVSANELAAIFCRTLQYHHLLFCMGVRDFVTQQLGRRLPIVILDPVDGARIFGGYHQSKVLETYKLEPRMATHVVPSPFSFLDLTSFLTLAAEDIILLHGMYGCTERCLRRVLGGAGEKVGPLILLGLEHAVKSDNVIAAVQLVKQAFPITVDNPSLSKMIDKLHTLCFQVTSTEMLVPLGAYTALCYFLSGQSRGRVAEACEVLAEWIRQSGSLPFRLQSWKEQRAKALGEAQAAPGLAPFIGQKAVQNRTAFRQALQDELSTAQNAVQFFMRLCSLLTPLQRPCLRLELLQYITGLHGQYSVGVMRRTAEFAFQCVAHGTQP
eukprot:EG_transcript_2088